MSSALGSVRPHSLYRRALLDEGDGRAAASRRAASSSSCRPIARSAASRLAAASCASCRAPPPVAPPPVAQPPVAPLPVARPPVAPPPVVPPPVAPPPVAQPPVAQPPVAQPPVAPPPVAQPPVVRPPGLLSCASSRCGLLSCGLLSCGLLPCRLLPGRCFSRRLLPCRLQLLRPPLSLLFGRIDLGQINGSLSRLLVDSRPRGIASISTRRHCGLRNRDAWHSRDDGRWHHRKCGYGPRGLVGPRQGDRGWRGDRRGRRVTGPIGGQRRLRRGRAGRGVCRCIGLCPQIGLRHDRCCSSPRSRRTGYGWRQHRSTGNWLLDRCLLRRLRDWRDRRLRGCDFFGTTTTRRSGASIRRTCQGKPKPGRHSPWPPKIRLNSHM